LRSARPIGLFHESFPCAGSDSSAPTSV
jgi:hypothetical protein